MRIQDLVTRAGAILASAALVLTPSAVHAAGGPIDTLDLGGLGPYATAVLEAPAEVTMKVYGSDMDLHCTSGSASGAWNTATADTAPLTFSALTMNCQWFLPGTTVTLQLLCNVSFSPGPGSKVTALQTDVVTGTVNAFPNCVKVTVTGGCTYYLTGANSATLDVNKKVIGGVNHNELVLLGSGFTISSSPAPTFGCLGAISAGSFLTMKSVTFNLVSNVNFLP